MRRSLLVVAGMFTLVALVASSSWAAGAKKTYVKQMFCEACHRALNKGLVERYDTTKHSKVKPDAKMAPVEIYRRSVGFNPADNTYFQPGVGCQDCHGPGSAHLAATTTAGKIASIVRPDKLKTQKQKLSLCGRCHGHYSYKGKPYVAGFQPGDDLLSDPNFKLLPVTGKEYFKQLNDFMTSKHAANGLSCITCHSGHEVFAGKPQLNKAIPDLCLQCHAKAHPCTLAQAQKPKDSTCVTCHMPDGRHLFSIPK